MSESRRAILVFLLGLALATSLACSSGPPRVACELGETGPITLGPRVGAVTETSAKIWVRGCKEVELNAQYRASGEDEWGEQQSAATETDLERDGTAVVELTELEPGTTYSYRAMVDGQPADDLVGEFKTMPRRGEPAVLTFFIGADNRPEGSKVAFETMTALDADFVFLIGDQIYVDPQLPPEQPSFNADGKEDYEAVYRDAWGVPEVRAFLANTPTYMMWDDHEILNDWDREQASPYPWARAAYDEYQNAPNPESYREGELYYVVRAGATELFVLDERTYRVRNTQRDGAGKTMLGSQQKADLKTWLLGSTAQFKFIVSPVMFGDVAKHTEEAWVSFRHERDEIFDYVTEHEIPGVVLLSGDEHWTAVLKLEPWGLYELSPTPLAGFSGAATEEASSDILFKLGQTAVFGSITIDARSCPAKLVMRVTDAFGRVRYEFPLSAAELARPLMTAPDYCDAVESGRIDSDNDGCSDLSEEGADRMTGGQRDPFNHWDFYDVNGDRRVDSRDALAVSESLGLELGDDGYDPLLDRSTPDDGAEPWLSGAPDGVIDDDDFFLVAEQIGTSCAA